MLRLVRRGTRSILISTGEIEVTAEWLMQNFSFREYGLTESFNKAEPYQTVVHLSPTARMGDIQRSILIESTHDEIIGSMINSKALPEDTHVTILPMEIIFRVTGDSDRIIQQICSDFHGTMGNVIDLHEKMSSKGVAVMFTEKPLNRSLSTQDLFPEMVYIDMPPELLYRHLQWRAMSYFNNALEGKDWNLVEIRIFDSYSRYQLHCRRLRLFLEASEMGITIGEGWGKDYAHVLMPLKVYTMKILTFYEPYVLKKALMGLEYSEQGNRFADFDLYMNKSKIGWTELSGDKKLDRSDRSLEFRKEVMGNLPDLHRHEILEIEKQIIQSGEKGNIEDKN